MTFDVFLCRFHLQGSSAPNGCSHLHKGLPVVVFPIRDLTSLSARTRRKAGQVWRHYSAQRPVVRPQRRPRLQGGIRRAKVHSSTDLAFQYDYERMQEDPPALPHLAQADSGPPAGHPGPAGKQTKRTPSLTLHFATVHIYA